MELFEVGERCFFFHKLSIIYIFKREKKEFLSSKVSYYMWQEMCYASYITQIFFASNGGTIWKK